MTHVTGAINPVACLSRVPVTQHLIASVKDTMHSIDHRRVRYGRDVTQVCDAQDLANFCSVNVAVAQFRVAAADASCDKSMLSQINSLAEIYEACKPRQHLFRVFVGK